MHVRAQLSGSPHDLAVMFKGVNGQEGAYDDLVPLRHTKRKWISHEKAHIPLCLAEFVVNTFVNNPN